MRIAVGQINPIVGNLSHNLNALLAAAAKAREEGADLFVSPELAITGYPPKDLLDRPGFVKDAVQALSQLNQQAPMPMLVGGVVSHQGDPLVLQGKISNGAVLMHAGQILACHRKILLPTYDVFDEARYFTPGTEPTVVLFAGTKLGISICEDIWHDKGHGSQHRYAIDPIAHEIAAGAELLINLSASPYDLQKPEQRFELLTALTHKHQRPLVYVNQVGGNDSLIFDGRSLCFNNTGQLVMRAVAFAESLDIVHYQNGKLTGTLAPEPNNLEENIVAALCLGLRDYLNKCNFKSVLVGLSGGIDSAVTAALAVRALGASRVMGLMMPSRYSSQSSIDDAYDCAQRLGIASETIPIEPMFEAYLQALHKPFKDLPTDATEENIQARIRGNLLMAYSNKFGHMVLTTGNKSEIAVGYCTLYGDMCGGLGPIADLYKTQVYSIAKYLNTHSNVAPIPLNTLTKAPSAELRPNQTDQDALPPYDVLDDILHGYIDLSLSPEQIIQQGHPANLVKRITTWVDRNEYKRRQMAPGLRISRKAFGEGRRLPLAQGYQPQ